MCLRQFPSRRFPEGFFMIRLCCPKCEMIIQDAAEQGGATVACPRCNFQSKVPSAAAIGCDPLLRSRDREKLHYTGYSGSRE
jgi:hypothetical protein